MTKYYLHSTFWEIVSIIRKTLSQTVSYRALICNHPKLSWTQLCWHFYKTSWIENKVPFFKKETDSVCDFQCFATWSPVELQMFLIVIHPVLSPSTWDELMQHGLQFAISLNFLLKIHAVRWNNVAIWYCNVGDFCHESHQPFILKTTFWTKAGLTCWRDKSYDGGCLVSSLVSQVIMKITVFLYHFTKWPCILWKFVIRECIHPSLVGHVNQDIR